MEHLRRRQDFVAAARALSHATPGMVVQLRNRLDEAGPRIGFTCLRGQIQPGNFTHAALGAVTNYGIANLLAATELESNGPVALKGATFTGFFFNNKILFFSSLFFAVISRSFFLSTASAGIS